MRQNWQMWSGGLSDEQVAWILEEAAKVKIERATIFTEAETDNVRKSDVGWLNDVPEVRDLLWEYVRAANYSAFRFLVENAAPVQYTEYHSEQGGHYDWHVDVNWNGEGPFDRKLSVTVQLSDPSEYAGGDFQFRETETPDAACKVKGTVLVFPSYLLHRVTPVTFGTRKSLVAWFEGPRWQ